MLARLARAREGVFPHVGFLPRLGPMHASNAVRVVIVAERGVSLLRRERHDLELVAYIHDAGGVPGVVPGRALGKCRAYGRNRGHGVHCWIQP